MALVVGKGTPSLIENMRAERRQTRDALAPADYVELDHEGWVIRAGHETDCIAGTASNPGDWVTVICDQTWTKD